MIFFFSSRRRHTRLQGDWSSDVCSSDLDPGRFPGVPRSRKSLSGLRDARGRIASTPPFGGSILQVSPQEEQRLARSEEHTSELQSPCNLVCRLLLEKKKQKTNKHYN